MTAQVIVGFDGSEVARATLACAARRMRREGHLTVAYVVAVPEALLESSYFDEALARSREHGQRVLDESKGALAPDTPVTMRLVEGSPSRALVELARELDAREIAIGSRGFGAFRSAVLGSTSHALLHEADRPVLIVARRAVERELRLAASATGDDEPQTTVVGYDGSTNSRSALEYAIRRAEASQGQVLAVCAYHAPSDWLGTPYYQRSLDEHQQRARELTRGLDDLPGVETDIVEGPPVDALIRTAQARDAAEIVVGARGLGRFQAALGSVSYALVHEADRPLIIVPSLKA
jgi:nucleotide-binding universal stress UspA family protein